MLFVASPLPQPGMNNDTTKDLSIPRTSLAVRATVGLTAITFVVLAGAQLVVQSLYANTIYPSVRIAGTPVGGLSPLAAHQILSKRANNYQLNIDTGLIKKTIRPADIGVEYNIDDSVKAAYQIGRNYWYAPLGVYAASLHNRLPLQYSTNHITQKAFITSIVSESGQAPVDASLQVVGIQPTVVPDKDGFSISASDVSSSLAKRVAGVDESAIILHPTVQKARIQSAQASAAIIPTKSLLAMPVTLSYNDQIFTATQSDIAKWLYFEGSTDGEPALLPRVNNTKVLDYVVKISSQIDKAPTVRKVTVENGVQRETQPGAEGLAVDRESLANAIATGLDNHIPVASTISTKPVAFKTVYNNVVTLAYGRYVEINLNTQHLYVWQDHQIIYDSPITSGATGADFETAKGLFSVQAKETNRHLIGTAYGARYNYDVFVHYWMPFYQGYGMHDASWRNGNFGGQDYYYGGSHGCVNLPDATAAWVYNWANVGDPVWVHR